MFTLREIAEITSGELFFLQADSTIKGVSADSRTIKEGELFIALKGERFDGSDFLDEVKRKKAEGAVVDRNAKAVAGLPVIRVEDTKRALGDIAKAHRLKHNISFIAITGSNGKTTTKDMIADILSRRFKVLKTERNENNQIGVPLTLLRLNDEEAAVIEMGTNRPGEIEYHCAVVRPTIALITNIGPSHLEKLKDIKGVLSEKLALIRSLPTDGIWVKNLDDPMLSAADYKNLRIAGYGIEKDNADFRASGIKQTKEGIEFRLKTLKPFSLKPQEAGDDIFYLPLLGVHNVYNALAAIATCSPFVDIGTIKKALAEFKGLHMRTEILKAEGVTIINDAYNSNPLSFRCAVSTLKDYPSSGRKIIITADMLELGTDSQRLQYESGRFLAENNTADFLITYGEGGSAIARGALGHGMDKARVRIFGDKEKMAAFLRSIVREGDTLLIKGSRGMKMEEALDCFTIYYTR